MDLTTVAVPRTLAHLKPLLPGPPARVLEVGCGRGALAAALAHQGYEVTGVDRNAEMAAAARERGVRVIQADVHAVSGEYDVVLFTRSLHHADDLDGILAHAAALLAPRGQVIVEEFAWERVDHAAADFLYDNRALLVAAGLLDAETPAGLDAWVAAHDFLHQGSAMLAALSRAGSDLTIAATAMLWRLVDGRGGTWTEPVTRAPDALDAIRRAEERRIAAGTLPAVGLLASFAAEPRDRAAHRRKCRCAALRLNPGVPGRFLSVRGDTLEPNPCALAGSVASRGNCRCAPLRLKTGVPGPELSVRCHSLAPDLCAQSAHHGRWLLVSRHAFVVQWTSPPP